MVVGVRACGINFPDVLIVQGKYQFKPTPPFSPGGEVAGVVEAVGLGVEGLRVGDRVTAFGPFGGLAEKLAADAQHVVKMPDGLDFVTASCLTTAYGTTLHALRDRANLKAGETLLVLGAAGGTGLSAVQIGKRMGARVIAAASSDEKLATCKAHGADAPGQLRQGRSERTGEGPYRGSGSRRRLRSRRRPVHRGRRSGRRAGTVASSSSDSRRVRSRACRRT